MFVYINANVIVSGYLLFICMMKWEFCQLHTALIFHILLLHCVVLPLLYSDAYKFCISHLLDACIVLDFVQDGMGEGPV
jgi:hypothetical protein